MRARSSFYKLAFSTVNVKATLVNTFKCSLDIAERLRCPKVATCGDDATLRVWKVDRSQSPDDQSRMQVLDARQLTDTCFMWGVVLDTVLCGLQLTVQGLCCWTSPPLHHLTTLSKHFVLQV
jgi:hypothetical protein